MPACWVIISNQPVHNTQYPLPIFNLIFEPRLIMSKQLIINADDFGRTRGISEGIIRAHKEGIVTSATAMMNMPGVANDLSKAKTEAPTLGLGVHLTFTAGRPLLPTEWVSSLIDEH